MSIEAIRRWCESNFTRGDSVEKARSRRELPRRGFCRSVGIDPGNFQRFLDGERELSPRVQRLMSRVILQWEAGEIAFTESAPRVPSRLVHRPVPAPKPGRMALVFEGGPKLKILPRLPSPEIRIFLTAKAK